MFDFTEDDRKLILRALEDDILALVVIDAATGAYEVVYSDGAYREFETGYVGDDFFAVWADRGLPLVYEPDRNRLAREITRERLQAELAEGGPFITTCRFALDGQPRYARIKVARDVLEPGTLALSIRDIDAEVRMERERAAEVERMRMRAFVGQMRPHFLYNAIGSIREVALTDPEYAADLLLDFATHLRANLRALGEDDLVPFSHELENVKAYTNIEQLRFGDKLAVEFDIRAVDFPIVPLGVQLLVENAVKHGIFERGAAGGMVTLRTREVEGGWEVAVIDTGVGFDVDAVSREIEDGTRDSTGLRNLRYRLEKVQHATLTIDSVVGEGTTAVVFIPKG